MGALPQPSEWATDLWSKFGDRFNRIESRQASLETARNFVFTSVLTGIDVSDAFFVGTYGEAAFTDVYVPKGYSQCSVLMSVSAGQSVAGTSPGSVGVSPKIKPSTTGTYLVGPTLANSTPAGGPISVSASYAQLVTGLTNGSTLRLAVWCSNTGPLVTQTCNVHLSASLLFLR